VINQCKADFHNFNTPFSKAKLNGPSTFGPLHAARIPAAALFLFNPGNLDLYFFNRF
jgi:hypothetical protein